MRVNLERGFELSKVGGVASKCIMIWDQDACVVGRCNPNSHVQKHMGTHAKPYVNWDSP